METQTFTGDGADLAAVRTGLEGLGYEVGRAVRVERTALDTFDGRLHASGLRVETERAASLVLKVSGNYEVPVHVDIGAAPRLVDDLPAGPLRARLGPVIDVRALLPLVTLTADRRQVVRRDRAGRVVVEAAIYEHLTVSPAGQEMPGWALEVMALTGYPKPAAALREHAERHGLKRHAGDALELAYAAAGVSRTGFDSSPTIPLSPDMPALEGYVAVLDHLRRAVAANWDAAAADLDPEFLHDLRVAARRTRSVLSQGKHVLPADVRKRFRAEFKWLGDATGAARDLDVYVIEWDTYLEGLEGDAAALAPVLGEIERRREAAHGALAKAMRTRRAVRLLPAWESWLANPRTAMAGQHADRPLGSVAGERITAAQNTLVTRGRTIGPDSPGELLHELRKDGKKLRYLLECFGGLLPQGPRKRFVKRLKALQDNLGEHQDAEVHIAQLHDLAHDLGGKGASAETLLAMGRLVQRLEEHQQASRSEFQERFGAYDTKSTRAALRDVLAKVQ